MIWRIFIFFLWYRSRAKMRKTTLAMMTMNCSRDMVYSCYDNMKQWGCKINKYCHWYRISQPFSMCNFLYTDGLLEYWLYRIIRSWCKITCISTDISLSMTHIIYSFFSCLILWDRFLLLQMLSFGWSAEVCCWSHHCICSLVMRDCLSNLPVVWSLKSLTYKTSQCSHLL